MVEEWRASVGLANVVDGIGCFMKFGHKFRSQWFGSLCFCGHKNEGAFGLERLENCLGLVLCQSTVDVFVVFGFEGWYLFSNQSSDLFSEINECLNVALDQGIEVLNLWWIGIGCWTRGRGSLGRRLYSSLLYRSREVDVVRLAGAFE